MKIGALVLRTPDLAAQRRFYSQALGLPLIQEVEGKEAVFQAGSSRITFLQAEEGWEGKYHFAFNIPPDQFPEAKEWLSRRAPLIRDHNGADEFDFTSWNAHSVYFYDPDGNVVELIARHDLPARSEKPFGGESLLSASEIGLASDDVIGLVGKIQSVLGASLYRCTLSDTFDSVGDENGLLICVKRGRSWFPDTGVPAGLIPVQARLAGADGRWFDVSGPPYEIV